MVIVVITPNAETPSATTVTKETGMLSVNGYTGQVWYHTWHGPFVQLKDLSR